MVDTSVLAVQQWLNETYEDVSGFIAVPETGKTGWSTMYALTRALQHELGISSLSNNFGAGTLSALALHGPVGAGEKNINIGHIVQGGLYAHGYNPYGFDGNIGPSTQSAIALIKSDMGLGSSIGSGLSPKEFKGLLTMSAYVLLPEGTTEARAVQQWMNQKYVNRRDFQIMPCDGLYSREAQKSLVYAIQYELDMSDSTANGNFGPSTREGLRVNGIFGVGAQDATKNFVRLFHAALIFNNVLVSFGPTFSDGASEKTSEFQRFCMLTSTGSADYQTWCSLLVSTGDPDRSGKALDTITTITPTKAKILTGLGYETVGRYLTNVPGGLNKKIQPGELNDIFSAGLTAFPIYQESGTGTSDFTYGKGSEHAEKAYDASISYGFPEKTTIYFAVDFDPTDEEINSSIIPYFRGIQNFLLRNGSRFKVGVYGTRNVCAKLQNSAITENSFISGMSTGFSGNLGFQLPTNWAFDQIQEYSVGTGGETFGIDKVVRSGRDMGASYVDKTIPSDAPNYAFLLFVDELSRLAETWSATVPAAVSAAELVCHWFRRNNYSDAHWTLMAGAVDQGFLEFATNELLSIGFTEEDLSTHDALDHVDYVGTQNDGKIDAQHLFAAANFYLKYGLPEKESVPGTADLGGFAGDLITVLNGYQQAKNMDSQFNPNLEEYALMTLLIDSPARSNRFEYNDFIEDCEAFNIVKEYFDSNESFSVSVWRCLSYAESHKSSAYRFADGRVNADKNSAYQLARSVLSALSSPSETLFGSLRAAMLVAFDPPIVISFFTEEERKTICDLFVDRWFGFASL